MSPRPTYSYGEPNWDTVERWLRLDPAEDGPVLMLNLMKYRAVARYSDGRSSDATGKQADDAYAPLESLAGVGATVAFFANVVEQASGDPTWDRVAIVNYPTRASFFEMQQRKDFQAKYTHKEAGMEFSIIMGCAPVDGAAAATPDGDGDQLVLRVGRRADPGRAPAPPEGATPVVTLAVDGVVLGDARTFDDVSFERWAATRSLAEAIGGEGVAEEFVMVVAPTIDHLTGPDPGR
jgi:hypothetical protein